MNFEDPEPKVARRPRDLPIERATRVYLVVNLNTSRALGLSIPRSILSRVDSVIE